MTRRNLAVIKSLVLLLLASSAAPALAADDSQGGSARWESPRGERSDARAARAAVRSQRSIGMERSIVAPEVEGGDADPPAVGEQRRGMIPQRSVERSPERASGRVVEAGPARTLAEPNRQSVEPRSSQRRAPRFVEVEPDRPALDQRETTDSVRGWRRAERDRSRSIRPALVEQRERTGSARPALVEQRTDTGWEPLRKRPEQRIEEAAGRADGRAPRISRTPVEGTQPPPPATASRITNSRVTASHWRGDWRSDRRFDWRDHRRRHGSLFRFGFYYDPFGWRYRPYSIGWRLWPSYYHSSYWLHDAWTYRLPYAPPGYRWIRYYDDALLVDTWDGRVVDVIRNFFW